jgi:hypothetical protein
MLGYQGYPLSKLGDLPMHGGMVLLSQNRFVSEIRTKEANQSCKCSLKFPPNCFAILVHVLTKISLSPFCIVSSCIQNFFTNIKIIKDET